MATEKPELFEIATTRDGRDITKGYIEGQPYLTPSDPVLQQAGGFEGYERLLKDDQVSACFAQRRRAVIARPWQVKPGGTKRQDKAAAELVKATLETLEWDTITEQMLYASFYGFAAAEAMWAIKEGRVCLTGLKVRDRRRFVFGIDNSLKLLTMRNPNGESVPEKKFWVASVGASHSDEPYGLGLGYAVFWPVWFKHNGARFWARFLEKFGSPTVVGTHPMGATDEQRDMLLEAARAVASDTGITIPEGTELKLLEATRGGDGSYDDWMAYWDGAIAKVILGQTMTTQDGSSYSQASVHYDVRQDIVKSDADLVCQSSNSTWVRWLVDFNFPGAAYPSIWRDMEDAEDLDARSKRDKTMFEIGYQLTPEAVVRVYGDDYVPIQPPTPAKEAPDDKPAQAAAPSPESEARPIGFRTNDLAEPEAPASPHPVTALAETLETKAAPTWKTIITQIETCLDKAKDMPSFRDELLNLYAELPIEQLGQVMGAALSVAELAGRYDAYRESDHD